jgi:hypothetical protein
MEDGPEQSIDQPSLGSDGSFLAWEKVATPKQLLTCDVEEEVGQPDEEDPVLIWPQLADLQEGRVGLSGEQINREQKRESAHYCDGKHHHCHETA